MRFRNRYNPNSTKPKREFSTGYLEDALDDLTSKIIRRLERVCFTCGVSAERTREGYLTCGHLFERRHRATRWDIGPIGNNHSQCSNCNADHEPHPEIYRNVFIKRFGQPAYDDLNSRAHSRMKITYLDLLAMYEGHKATWEALKKAA